MQELADELAKTELEIAAIQTRWSGTGLIKKKDLSLYYSGTKDQIGQADTGFILLGGITNNVTGFEAINERFCKVRIKSKYNNLTLINMCASMEDKTDTEKEKFYDDLQTAIDRTPKSDTVLVLGDANAKLGKEDVHTEVRGKHMLHELSNRNGEMLLELALGNNLTVLVKMASEEVVRNIYTRFLDKNCGENGEIVCQNCCHMKDHLELLINELKSSQLIIRLLQEEIN
jgi:exonuclease III